VSTLAVIFTAVLRPEVGTAYAKTGQRMRELAEQMPGFVRIDSVQQGVREITVSYWESAEALATWRDHPDHRAAQQRGRREWYETYDVHVCRVERAREFER
jgi:heme-degrading monooxygenase HmoA